MANSHANYHSLTPDHADQDYIAIILSILNDSVNSEPLKLTADITDDFFRFSSEQGVTELLYHHLFANIEFKNCPGWLTKGLLDRARRSAAQEFIRQQETKLVLDTLSQESIIPILLKGVPLAYLHYPSPDLRPRLDTDILIPEKNVDDALNLLKKISYQKEVTHHGHLLQHQICVTKTDTLGNNHCIDLHWKISNRHAVANAFTYDEFLENSQSVPQLGANARTPDILYSLLFACLHRAAHHIHEDRLIWQYDIHLLANKLNQNQWNRFIQLAKERKICTLCIDGLHKAKNNFHSLIPNAILEKLSSSASSNEPSFALLKQNRNRLDDIRSDFKSIQTSSQRFRLLFEHVFPPLSYMRQRYPNSTPLSLPFYYLRRFIKGVFKLLRNS